MNPRHEQRAAKTAAYFLKDGKMSHLKLMSLMYLANREYVRISGWMIYDDHLVSRPNGPVLIQTLELMSGMVESQPGGWEEWIFSCDNHEFSQRKQLNIDDYTFGSRKETLSIFNVLNETVKKYGGMDQWVLQDWIKANCDEWTDPAGSALPIQYEDLAFALGVDFDEELMPFTTERWMAKRQKDRI